MIRAVVIIALVASACTIRTNVLTIDSDRQKDTASFLDARPCFDDSGCTFGAEICTAEHCEACPDLTTCTFACPTNWVHLQRNGCDECECAPPVTCNAVSAACTGGTCQESADCASDGCLPSDTKCCATQCVPAATSCLAELPVGCVYQCSTALSQAGCSRCLAESCTCQGGAWSCTTVCAPANYLASCP